MAKVRNVRAIGGTKPIPVIHFIPPAFSLIYKFEIVTDTETIDVTELLVKGEYFDGVTDSIGGFDFRFLDPTNSLSNRVEEFDTINIYMDYGNSATTKRFSGKIEKKSNSEQAYFDISGRSVAMITTGIYVTYNSDGPKSRSTILTEIIDKYFSGTISTSGIETDTGTMDVNYFEIPFWSVVEEICNAGTRDAYISEGLVFNYFERGSRLNTTEAIVENINLVDSSEYGKDTEEIYTGVKVYGSRINEIPIISSSDQDTTNTKGITKNLKVDNESVLDHLQAKDLADAKFTFSKDAPVIGVVTSLATPTILPGERVRIANPTNNIPPSYYDINSFKHVFKEDDVPKTIFNIKKRKLSVPQLLKKNFVFQNQITSNPNPNEMDYSIVYDFSDASGTFNNTERVITQQASGITSAKYALKTISGDTGSWTSENITFTPKNITHLEIRTLGDVLSGTPPEGTKVQYSLDGGVVFQTLSSTTTTVETKGQLQIRVNLSSEDTRVNAVGVLYKLSS